MRPLSPQLQHDWAGTDGYMLDVKHTQDLVVAFTEIAAAMAANAAHFEARKHFRKIETTDGERTP